MGLFHYKTRPTCASSVPPLIIKLRSWPGYVEQIAYFPSVQFQFDKIIFTKDLVFLWKGKMKSTPYLRCSSTVHGFQFPFVFSERK